MSNDLAAFLLYLAGGGMGVILWLRMWRKATWLLTVGHVVAAGAATIALAAALREEETALRVAAISMVGLTAVAGLNLLVYHFGTKVRPSQWEIWAHFGGAIAAVGLMGLALAA